MCIQSNINNVFKHICQDAAAGKKILFCGCPCQTAALQNCLGALRKNVYLVDFICRGVNSPKVLQAFLNMLERQYRSKVSQVWFKNKTLGWNCFSTKVIFENDDFYLKNRYEDPFIQGYIHHNLYMRPSCYNCRFKDRNTLVADITLADFWGIGNAYPELDNDMGTSMVILNTEKGKELFAMTLERLESRMVDMETAAKGNPCLRKSPRKNPRRHAFLVNLDRLGFEKCYAYYTRPTLKEKMKNAYYSCGHCVKFILQKCGVWH